MRKCCAIQGFNRRVLFIAAERLQIVITINRAIENINRTLANEKQNNTFHSKNKLLI